MFDTISAIRRFFEDLFAGDPVALTFVGVVVGIFLLFGLFWLKVHLDFKREERQKKNRLRRDAPVRSRGKSNRLPADDD
jgi:hypothetical protein